MKSYIGPGVQWSDPHHDGKLVEVRHEDDGRWHHRFSQSWLKQTDICLERARQEHAKEMPKVESDAANVGTAAHDAIETCLLDPLTLADTLQVFNDAFSEYMLDPAFQWIKYTERSARKFGELCVTQWHNEVLPTLPEQRQLETRFIVPFVDNDERVIELSGSIDYFDGTLRDWKTSGGRDGYEKWELQRWNVQATVYTYAAWQLHMVSTNGNTEPIDFEFVVLGRREVQRVPITRTANDWSFLADKATRIARLIESGLSPWPVNDNHALCSPKWCPSWDGCKGSHGITF